MVAIRPVRHKQAPQVAAVVQTQDRCHMARPVKRVARMRQACLEAAEVGPTGLWAYGMVVVAEEAGRSLDRMALERLQMRRVQMRGCVCEPGRLRGAQRRCHAFRRACRPS